MSETTNEFSFVLKPSAHGVGVFATHDIKEGTFLRLFGDEQMFLNCVRKRSKESVPEPFREYCIWMEDGLVTPVDFGYMQPGWYLNHSRKNANATHIKLSWYAARDIKAGEEILIDYNTLGEPVSLRDEYYRK